MRSATAWGWETYTEWLLETSGTEAPALWRGFLPGGRGLVGRFGFLGLSCAQLFKGRSQYAARQAVESGLARLTVSDREEERVE